MTVEECFLFQSKPILVFWGAALAEPFMQPNIDTKSLPEPCHHHDGSCPSLFESNLDTLPSSSQELLESQDVIEECRRVD